VASLPDINEKLDTLTEKVSEMATDMAALVRGLDLMTTTQGTHSEMLENIMTACSVKDDGAPELHDALVEIAAKLERQNELLTMIGGNLHGLGATIQVAVIRGMQRAVSGADDDGVVPDDGHHGHSH
jgi:uncharacterized coiled-coil DUF342 family protein